MSQKPNNKWNRSTQSFRAVEESTQERRSKKHVTLTMKLADRQARERNQRIKALALSILLGIALGVLVTWVLYGLSTYGIHIGVF